MTESAPADCDGMAAMAGMDHHAPAEQTPSDCCQSSDCAMAHCGAPVSALSEPLRSAAVQTLAPDDRYRFSLAVAPPLRLYRPPIFS